MYSIFEFIPLLRLLLSTVFMTGICLIFLSVDNAIGAFLFPSFEPSFIKFPLFLLSSQPESLRFRVFFSLSFWPLIPFNFLVAEKNSYSPPEKDEKSIFKR